MKVLKKILFCFFLVIAAADVFAQNTPQGNADIVILLDTSGTVLQYYEEVNKRVLKEITDKFVRKGDTVHVLSFNADARYEMSQKVNSEADLSRVVSRFLLLYQLGKNSDFLTGLAYCKQYTSSLSASKEQILIVISDGIFNPPESSPYKNYSGEQIKNEIGLLAGDIRRGGWKVYYVKLPYPADSIIRDLDGEEFYNSTAGGSKSGFQGGSSGSSQSGNLGGSSGGAQGSGNTGHAGAAGSVGGSTSGGSGSSGAAGGTENTGDSGNTGNTSDTETGSTGNSGASGTESGSGYGTGGSADNSSASGGDKEADGGKTKEYTDVSKTFTDSAGASTSELSGNGEFSIEDNGKNLPSVIFPEELKSYGGNLTFPLEIKNTSEEEIELKLTEIILDNGYVLNKIPVNTEKITIQAGEKAVINVKAKLPQDYSEGSYNAIMRLEFEDGKKVLPQAAELKLSVFPSAFKRIFGSNILFILIPALLLLLLLLLIIFFVLRRRTSNPVASVLHKTGSSSAVNYDEEDINHAKCLDAFTQNSNMQSGGFEQSVYSESNKERIAAQAKEDEMLRKKILSSSFSAQQPRGSHISPANHLEKIEIKSNQSGMTEIYVLNQNRYIGKRNIHIMKPGTRLSVGGGKSDDFLIFLVPFPAHLAQVRYDGQDYHLAILKPEYFPYETSNVVNNCVGKTVTVVSDKGYHVYFTFRGYEDPAVKLNSLLTSIKYE